VSVGRRHYVEQTLQDGKIVLLGRSQRGFHPVIARNKRGITRAPQRLGLLITDRKLDFTDKRGPFFGSVELNHRSLQLDSAGPDAAEDRFRPAHTMWDLSLSYQFHPRWRTFVDVENVTEVPSRIYEGDPSRVEEYWLEPRRFRFGVKWEM